MARKKEKCLIWIFHFRSEVAPDLSFHELDSLFDVTLHANVTGQCIEVYLYIYTSAPAHVGEG